MTKQSNLPMVGSTSLSVISNQSIGSLLIPERPFSISSGAPTSVAESSNSITSVELSAETEIRDTGEGTPRSIDVARPQHTASGRQYTNALLAIATATQIFGSSHPGITDNLLFSKDLTPLIDENQRQYSPFVSYPHVSTVGLRAESEGELANRTRLELLARLYVSKKLSGEEEARLAIVIQKVRRLIPRVTADDFEALGEIAQESEAIHAENTERRRRLGI